MSLNPVGTTNYNWNYTKPDREGYSLELTGTIIALQEVQARTYNPNSGKPGLPRFWDDGNPVMNIRVCFATATGDLKTMVFQKAGKKQVAREKPSVHMQFFDLTNGNMLELIGKTVHIWTWPAHPESNQPWMQGNPRLFGMEEVKNAGPFQLSFALPEEYKVPELLCNDAASGGQPVAPAPQQIQTPTQVPPMNGQYYAPPSAQQQPQYQPQQQMPVAQPQPQPQPAVQQMPPQQTTAPMPQGMDPAVAAAMQAVGATNVQPVDETGGVYDEDIPF